MTDRPHCLSREACISASERHCKRCASIAVTNDPEVRRKRAEKARARYTDPAERLRLGEACRKGWAEALTDPQFAEEQRQRGMLLQAPHNIARRAEARRVNALAWCPAEYRELNQKLSKAGYRLTERKAMIRDAELAAGRREVARISREMIQREQHRRAQAY